MNQRRLRRYRKYCGGLTLIEILIVIAILAVVAAMLFPAITDRPKEPKMSRTEREMKSIQYAVEAYDATYGRFPISANVGTTNSGDLTFGTIGTDTLVKITNASGLQANNSEVISILCDLQRFENGVATVNAGHARNSKETVFLKGISQSTTNGPGIGNDGVFRDPWGTPYVITFDLNSDKRCSDAFYRLASVSETFAATNSEIFRLKSPPFGSEADRDSFEVKGRVLIWSLGPNQRANPRQPFNIGENRDNVVLCDGIRLK